MCTGKKIGVWGLCVSIFRGIKRRATSTLFWVGVAFLVLNIPLGYLFLGMAALMTSLTRNARWTVIGTIGYVVTWAMLLSAPVLMGKQNFIIVKQVIKDKVKAWKRLRQRNRTSR